MHFFSDEAGECMRKTPVSDHSVSFTALSSGTICLSAASSNYELHAAFPDSLSSYDACRTADLLFKYLQSQTDKSIREALLREKYVDATEFSKFLNNTLFQTPM